MSENLSIPDQSLDSSVYTAPDCLGYHHSVISESSDLFASKSGSESWFMNLPAELRIRIYEMIVVEEHANPHICTWQNPWRMPCHSKICDAQYLDSTIRLCFSSRAAESSCYEYREPLSSPSLTCLALNKQVYEEACNEFYTKRTFRFTSEQVTQLLQRPDVFHRLRSIEIEDTYYKRQVLDLEGVIRVLASADKMEKIVIGTYALYLDLCRPISSPLSFPRKDHLSTINTDRIFYRLEEIFHHFPNRHTVSLPNLPKIFFVDFPRREVEEARQRTKKQTDKFRQRVEELEQRVKEKTERPESDPVRARVELAETIGDLAASLDALLGAVRRYSEVQGELGGR